MDSEVVSLINRRIDDANENNNRRFDALDEKMGTFDHKLDGLIKFRWQIFGASAAVVFIITLVFNVLQVFAK